MNPLFVQDIDALRCKLSHPPPLLTGLYRRFEDRLRGDSPFRRLHVFLPALLGDTAAIDQARDVILEEAQDPLVLARSQSPASDASAQQSLDEHIWCLAPRAMRLAAFFTWLDIHDAWSDTDKQLVGHGLVDYFYRYVVPVLRARIPAGHNQQLSMTLGGTVVGAVFAEVPGVARRAAALRDFALPKLRQTLGLMPRGGYCGEGSTYQSDVVSGLAMWAGLYLRQDGDAEVWSRRWPPNDASLVDTLRLEAALASPGGLLPPWDQYGWTPLHNLAARTLWASLAGQHHLLRAAEEVWDRPSFLAWRDDDRLWTLLCWPDREIDRDLEPSFGASRPVLAGWSLPNVAAAIDHLPRRLRVMLAWDRCAGNLQGVCREQVNPNHLMIELAGQPITADGWDDGSVPLFTPEAMAPTLAGFSDSQRRMTTQQYGDLDRWVRTCQQGFLGAACSIIIDHRDGYIPDGPRQGRLAFEQRTADRHTIAGDCTAYYQPVFDVTRMRRTVSVSATGVIWIIDDIAADSSHLFTWRVWFRTGVRRRGANRLKLDLPDGLSMTVAWVTQPSSPALDLTRCPTFPTQRPGLKWPDHGSTRFDLTVQASSPRLVFCMVPEAVDDLVITTQGESSWRATWSNGSDEVSLTDDPCSARHHPAHPPDVETLCDLDEVPFDPLDQPSPELLAALIDPSPAAWRFTTAAMQTLTIRNDPVLPPLALSLLEDPAQNYTVHSVAAWCLGRTCYAPALPALARVVGMPEVNTSRRAAWAVDAIKTRTASKATGGL